MKAFLIKNSEVRNDNPFNDGDRFPGSPKPDAAALKVPYNLALNQYDALFHVLDQPLTTVLGFVIFQKQQPSALSSIREHWTPTHPCQAGRSSKTEQ